MADEEMSESEQAQLRKVIAFQKVSLGIALKWKWLFLLLILLLGTTFTSYLRFKATTSVARFEAVTRLLFNPRKVARIENLTDRQLMSILNRPSLKRKIADQVEMPVQEKQCLVKDVEIVQERHPSNLFSLNVASQSEKGAAQKANAYAEILIEEYVAYRTADLESWRASVASRRKTLLDQLAAIEAEEATLKAKTGVVSPQEALLTLNTLISDQRRNLSALGVDIANEDVKRRRLEKEVGTSGPAIVANAAAIRRRAEAIAAIDKELVALREVYTDRNPKVVGKLEDRKVLVKELEDFLKSKGVADLNVEGIDQIEKSAGELAECGTRLAAIGEKRRALEQELADNEKKASELTAMIPEYERLMAHHADLELSVRNLGEQLSDIAYSESSLRNDLRQIERAHGGSDKGNLGVKKLVIAVCADLICFGGVLVVVLLLEFLYGSVRGGKEIAAYDGIHFLGSLPTAGALPDDEAREVMGVVALKLLSADVPRGVMLVASLPGASKNTHFTDVLDYTATMSGTRLFTLNIVASSDFSPPEDAEQMIGAVTKEAQGWFPVQNRLALAPTELQMLQADIAELRKNFDTVFILMDGGVRKGGSFFDQLLGICESVILLIGSAHTPRSWFGYVRRHVEAVEKPMVAIATDARKKVIRAEMESKL